MNNIEFWGNVFAYLIIVSLLAKPTVMLLVTIYAFFRATTTGIKGAVSIIYKAFKREKVFFILLLTVLVVTPILIAVFGDSPIPFVPLAIFLMLVLPIYIIKFLICIIIRLFRDQHPVPKV